VNPADLIAELFNRMTTEQKNAVPGETAKAISRYMVGCGFRLVFDRWYRQFEPERDSYQEALEQIRDLTIACNGGLTQNVHAIAQLALDPEGCADLARIPLTEQSIPVFVNFPKP